MSFFLFLAPNHGPAIAFPPLREDAMHIHGQIPNVSAASFFGISAGDRAAQAQRAAETRKKLLKAGRSAAAAVADPDATFLVGRWMEAGLNQAPSGDEDTGASGLDFDLD
jgi:hypothetical protein